MFKRRRNERPVVDTYYARSDGIVVASQTLKLSHVGNTAIVTRTLDADTVVFRGEVGMPEIVAAASNEVLAICVAQTIHITRIDNKTVTLGIPSTAISVAVFNNTIALSTECGRLIVQSVPLGEFSFHDRYEVIEANPKPLSELCLINLSVIYGVRGFDVVEVGLASIQSVVVTMLDPIICLAADQDKLCVATSAAVLVVVHGVMVRSVIIGNVRGMALIGNSVMCASMTQSGSSCITVFGNNCTYNFPTHAGTRLSGDGVVCVAAGNNNVAAFARADVDDPPYIVTLHLKSASEENLCTIADSLGGTVNGDTIEWGSGTATLDGISKDTLHILGRDFRRGGMHITFAVTGEVEDFITSAACVGWIYRPD